MTEKLQSLNFYINLLFSFAANITNISDEPAARTFKLPFGMKQRVFVF
jgi:hypothetical protein